MRVVVVGNGAREHALVRTLSSEGHFTSAFHTKGNLGIERDASTHVLSTSFAAPKVISYAQSVNADTILIGTEKAIRHGIKEEALGANISCFAPSRRNAKLEFDRIFAKNLVGAIDETIILPIAKIESPSEARAFSKQFGFPLILRVSNPAGGRTSIHRIEEGKHDQLSKLVAEGMSNRRLLVLERAVDITSEFYVYALSDGYNNHTSFVVRDYPNLYDHEIGPKTGGMGSVSSNLRDMLVDESDVNRATRIMHEVLTLLGSESNDPYTGFLVGQFIKSGKQLFFNEFDVRPGDSEVVNLLRSLKTPLGEILSSAAVGQLERPELNNHSVVCIHHVPFGYPNRPTPYIIGLDAGFLDLEDVYVGDLNQHGPRTFITGSGRAILTVGSSASNLQVARKMAYELSDHLDSLLYRRTDIAALENKSSNYSRTAPPPFPSNL